MGNALKNLEELWELLANTIDSAGPEREALFLSKLALMLGNELQDAERVRELIGRALEDLS